MKRILSSYLLVYLCIHSSILLFNYYLSIHSFIHLFIYWLVELVVVIISTSATPPALSMCGEGPITGTVGGSGVGVSRGLQLKHGTLKPPSIWFLSYQLLHHVLWLVSGLTQWQQQQHFVLCADKHSHTTDTNHLLPLLRQIVAEFCTSVCVCVCGEWGSGGQDKSVWLAGVVGQSQWPSVELTVTGRTVLPPLAAAAPPK